MLWRCEIPWEGNKFGTEISRRESLPQALEVWSPNPLLPLQHLAEDLIELLLYQAQEGSIECGLLTGLRLQPQD